MGYTTHFWGQVDIRPVLDKTECARLRDWSALDHRDGSTPGIWCGWVPTESGDGLIWDQSEKFYEAAQWMRYLIDRFIVPNHSANGVVFAYAEPEGLGYFDVWRMDVLENAVSVGEYDVPILHFDAESENLVEQIELCSAINEYVARPDLGVSSVERQLRLIHEQLGYPTVAEALARFLRDAAAVLPQPARLRAAIEPYLVSIRHGSI